LCIGISGDFNRQQCYLLSIFYLLILIFTIMKTKYFIFAALVATGFASCTNDDFVGDLSPNVAEETGADGAIKFGFNLQNATRADIYGEAAAKLLGNNFYVTGTKGTEAATSPTPTLVFDNYLVHYAINTAGTTESNTANWEYVGIDQDPSTGSPTVANHVKLSSTSGAQTIKYWDYSVAQYDFWAFSTGTKKAVNKTDIASVADDEIGVTASVYGTNLASNGVAYTFYVPTVDAVKNAYITDITEVTKASNNYGKDVTLRFKSLGSKVRIALYETVPGYSVKNVKFYQVDGTNTDLSSATKYDDAYLISADANGLPTKGTIKVYFPRVGNDNASAQDYDKAAATVTPVTTSSVKTQGFGALTSQLIAKERAEVKESSGSFVAEDGTVFLGRDLPHASFAGSEAAKFYQTVFPVSTSSALTLRVDYTLVPIDGASETINVYGAKAVVPNTYTKWLPNYAYTYIFKISDNTNGWTSTVTTDPAGLFPITFDAVVAEATDATAEQKTITTVATPSITTYQQNHDITKDEYSITTGKDIYVQVMDNSTTTPVLYTNLNGTTSDDPATNRSRLFSVTTTGAGISEATVMDALQSRNDASLSTDDVKGRNGITLTKNTNIDNTVTSIVNGADNQPIGVNAGEAAKLTINSLSSGTYAYVYDYSGAAKTTVTEYQPINVTVGSAIGTSGKKYASITIANLGSTETADNEDVSNGYIYFSKTTNGTGTTTYSYVSVAGKTKLPAGLIKVAKSSLITNVDGNTNAVADTFYFDIYTTNSGKYAVKVIKIVA